MSDLIDRQAAIQGVRELFSLGDCYCDELSIVGMLNGLSSVKSEKQTVKVIYVEKPIIGDEEGKTIKVTSCENCENVVSIFDNFCPNCGARLEWG